LQDLREAAAGEVQAPDMPFSRLMWLRVQVLRAATYLVVARFLVRFVPFHLWRPWVGEAVAADSSPCSMQACNSELLPGGYTPEAISHAHWVASCVERAATRLPGLSRCLPKAVALQWLLLRQSIHASTVIAFKIGDRSGEDAYHAWVELDGEMLMGQCERSAYRPIMVLYRPVKNRPEA
jgi:hypothetical protein